MSSSNANDSSDPVIKVVPLILLPTSLPNLIALSRVNLYLPEKPDRTAILSSEKSE